MLRRAGEVMTDPDLSKYFPDALALQQRYQADVVFLCVLGGTKGTGGCPAFSLQGGDPRMSSPDARRLSALALALSRMMRFIADDLEKRFVRPEDRSS